MKNSLHEIFTNLKSQASSLHVIFTYWEPTHSGDHHASLFAWRLLEVDEWLWSYDGINFGQLKAHLLIQDKNQSTLIQVCTHWDVPTISN